MQTVHEGVPGGAAAAPRPADRPAGPPPDTPRPASAPRRGRVAGRDARHGGRARARTPRSSRCRAARSPCPRPAGTRSRRWPRRHRPGPAGASLSIDSYAPKSVVCSPKPSSDEAQRSADRAGRAGPSGSASSTAAAVSTKPQPTIRRGPIRRRVYEPVAPAAIAAKVSGSSRSPVSSGLRPSTSWRYWTAISSRPTRASMARTMQPTEVEKAGLANIRMSISGCARRFCRRTKSDEQRAAQRTAAPAVARPSSASPAPSRFTPRTTPSTPGRGHQRAEHVPGAVVAAPRLGQQQPAERQDHGHQRDVDQEDRAPPEVLDEEAAEHRSDGRADRGDRGPDADRDAPARAGRGRPARRIDSVAGMIIAPPTPSRARAAMSTCAGCRRARRPRRRRRRARSRAAVRGGGRPGHRACRRGSAARRRPADRRPRSTAARRRSGRRSSVTAGTATCSTVASSATSSRLTQRTTRTTQRLAPSAGCAQPASRPWSSRTCMYLPNGPSRSAGQPGMQRLLPLQARHRRASDPSAYASSAWPHVVHLIPRRTTECGVRHAGPRTRPPPDGARHRRGRTSDPPRDRPNTVRSPGRDGRRNAYGTDLCYSRIPKHPSEMTAGKSDRKVAGIRRTVRKRCPAET